MVSNLRLKLGYSICILFIIINCLHFTLTKSAAKVTNNVRDEAGAIAFLQELDSRYSEACNAQITARWDYITNVTDETEQISVSKFIVIFNNYNLPNKILFIDFSYFIIISIICNLQIEAQNKFLEFQAEVQRDILQQFPEWDSFTDETVKRELKFLAIQGPANMSSANVAKVRFQLTS